MRATDPILLLFSLVFFYDLEIKYPWYSGNRYLQKDNVCFLLSLIESISSLKLTGEFCWRQSFQEANRLWIPGKKGYGNLMYSFISASQSDYCHYCPVRDEQHRTSLLKLKSHKQSKITLLKCSSKNRIWQGTGILLDTFKPRNTAS